jgi:hypothetical protein
MPVPTGAPVAPIRGRRVAQLERRRRRGRLVALGLLIVVLAGAGLIIALPHGSRHASLPPPKAFGRTPPSVAWALSWNDPDLGASLAVVGVPPGDPAIAVVASDDARVDLPNGAPLTVGPASVGGPEAIETAQALLNRRVGHYLVSTPQDISALVDRLGGITFGAQGSAIVDGEPVGPGQTTATGAQAAAYLTTGTGVAAWVRWEDVLSGILGARENASAWSGVPGTSDDAAAVGPLLAGAHGATVVDLPTTETFGVLKVDTAGMDAMLNSSFKASVGGLVRVIVQNGNGRPGMGQQIGSLLAPYGYRVIESQNAGTFDLAETKIVASTDAYQVWAREAQRLLGAGSVYRDAQSTGIADITIVVGKDYGMG